MPDILIGDQISTAWWPAAVENDQPADISNVTSTVFIPGATTCDVTFTASRTGRAGVCIAANWIQQSAGERMFFAYEVYLGTSAAGTLVRSARSGFGVSDAGSTLGSLEQGWGNMTMVEGLTPGATYFARLVFMTEGAGGTNDITHRRIIVFPLP